MNMERIENEMLIRGYSENQIDTYLSYLQVFYNFIDKPLRHATIYDVLRFKEYLLDKDIKAARINSALVSIRECLKIHNNIKLEIDLIRQPLVECEVH